MRMKLMFFATAVLVLRVAGAQAPTVDHLTQAELIEKAQALTANTHVPVGAASAKLKEYPNHFTMISLRDKDGGAEIHQEYSDLFFVLRGKATLLSGDDLQDSRTASPGEIRGTSVKNGTSMLLNQGDFVHIPAGVAHQLLIANGESFIYFVVKVKEK